MCVPASINNDLPASDLSIGADTALNSIVTDVDKIKQSAVASHRCFVVEVMGEDCGFLALMGGMATGAERVYLPEEGITLERLSEDLDVLRAGFAHGKRLGLVIRGEGADALYTTSFIESLFNHESNGLFDVRGAILGHVQDGGQPSPFDRIQATTTHRRRRRSPHRPSRLRRPGERDGRHAGGQDRVHPAAESLRPRRRQRPTAAGTGMVDGAAAARRHHGAVER